MKKQYDLMILGPATRDVNIDYTGEVDRCVGGAVTFCTPAARATGASVFAAVKIAPEDRDMLAALGGDPADAALLPSRKTTLMRNEYFTADRERRNASCPAQSDPITPEDLPDVSCRLYHLAGLLYGDFPNGLIEDLRERGMVSADARASCGTTKTEPCASMTGRTSSGICPTWTSSRPTRRRRRSSPA